MSEAVNRALKSIDMKRLKSRFDEISEIGKTEKGMNRHAYSPENKEALTLVMKWMKRSGLKISHDPMYNVFAKKEGEDANAKSILTGSHIDTVIDGGRFDGTLGVLVSLECMHVMSELDLETKKSLELAVFAAEESTRFSAGTIGSRAIAGTITRDMLDRLVDLRGVSLFEAVKTFGGQPDDVRDCQKKKDEIEAIVELHIEQGPVLDELGKEIGIVRGVVSIDRLMVTIRGQAIHSGGGVMRLRRDALVAASEIVLLVRNMGKKHSRIRVTVGRVEVYPGSLNTVPGQAKVGIDLRVFGDRDRYLRILMNEIDAVCKSNRVAYKVTSLYQKDFQAMSPSITRVIAKSAGELDLDFIRIPSFGGHDAQVVGRFAKCGMIFVPSKHGISHNWVEWTDFRYVRFGAKLLLSTLLKLAEVT